MVHNYLFKENKIFCIKLYYFNIITIIIIHILLIKFYEKYNVHVQKLKFIITYL